MSTSPTPPLVQPPSMPPDLRRSGVVITGVDMSIAAMCRFMVKWAIAAIPAALIFWLFFMLVGAIFAFAFRGLHHFL